MGLFLSVSGNGRSGDEKIIFCIVYLKRLVGDHNNTLE